MSYQVHRDGTPVSPVLDSENEAFAWVLRHQGQSFHYATTYGGYEVVEVGVASGVGEPRAEWDHEFAAKEDSE